MSTKRLARTVIEGGRRRYNKYQRRYSNCTERAAWRRVEAELRLDADEYDRRVIDPRPQVSRSFFDKLGPMRRWLRSFVGRPWAEVEGLVLRTFDTRTLPGRHIVFDHLLGGEVDLDGPGYERFFVDELGVLREARRRRYQRRWRAPPAWALEWIGARKIGERGSKAYWFVPVARGFDLYSYRQHLELDAHELARWRSLVPEDRERWRMELPPES